MVWTDFAWEQCELPSLRSVRLVLASMLACRHAYHPNTDHLAWQRSALALACWWPWIMFLFMTCLQRVQGSNYICLQAVLKRWWGEEKAGKKRNHFCNLEESLERLFQGRNLNFWHNPYLRLVNHKYKLIQNLKQRLVFWIIYFFSSQKECCQLDLVLFLR